MHCVVARSSHRGAGGYPDDDREDSDDVTHKARMVIMMNNLLIKLSSSWSLAAYRWL